MRKRERDRGNKPKAEERQMGRDIRKGRNSREN
jgi:hypothetical protein